MIILKFIKEGSIATHCYRLTTWGQPSSTESDSWDMCKEIAKTAAEGKSVLFWTPNQYYSESVILVMNMILEIACV